MTTSMDFEAFVREHQDMVYTTALRLLGREAEAEDMASEAFVRAFERFDDIKDGASPGGWLRTVTTNLCLNHLQRHRGRWRLFSELESEDGGAVEETFAAPAPAQDGEDRLALLDEALLKLPEAQRVPLVLFHFEELPYEDIARKLGVSLGKVKTDIHRGRGVLRKIVGEEDL